MARRVKLAGSPIRACCANSHAEPRPNEIGSRRVAVLHYASDMTATGVPNGILYRHASRARGLAKHSAESAVVVIDRSARNLDELT